MNEGDEDRIWLAQRIKQDLPNIPEDVIDIWLAPLAKHPTYGWPPTIDTSSNWRYVLLRENLDYWASTTWQLTERKLVAAEISLDSQWVARSIYECHLLQRENEFSNIENSKERFS